MTAASNVIGIVGPTGVGKTSLADGLARRIVGEVVGADSMQVYRGMDIGTAKQPHSSRGVPYHCIDILDPGEAYSAALYQREARAAIEDIVSRGNTPILVGGTGLYVRAALDELDFPLGELTGPTRKELERRAAEFGPDVLYAELQALDPEAAARIHPNNVRRTIRALEMLGSGVSYATQAAGFSSRRFHYPGARLVGIEMARDELYARIDARVREMIREGLVSEVEALLAQGYRGALTASQAIGYKEIVRVIDGYESLDSATESIQQASRRYAKRQLTWFRADPRIEWLDVTGLSAPEALQAALDLLSSAKPNA
ncbi:MAG: tRNA (adenosine(37)-N6)-dimethylallyltransferase MiaA [Actinobacteria bacterium]|nr:tRNA (adenosine(37)-N6)-dimethylallyltransferase MiaA [Actinomycetota bacterium]